MVAKAYKLNKVNAPAKFYHIAVHVLKYCIIFPCAFYPG